MKSEGHIERAYLDLVGCCRELTNSVSQFAFLPVYSQKYVENPAAARQNYPNQTGKVCSAASDDSVIF